jgi:hypothetical protein
MAHILGTEREVRGWTKDRNLVLADGSEYTFEPLREPVFDFTNSNRKLISVESLVLENGACGAWVVGGKPLRDCKNTTLYGFLNGSCSPFPEFVENISGIGIHNPALYRPVTGEILPGGGHWTDPRLAVCAVAWFAGVKDPVLLRSFRLNLATDEHAHAVAEVLAPKFKELAAKVETVDGKADKLLADTQTLKDMGAEESASRDKWRENPLCCRDAMADYLLTMDGQKINRNVAVALLGIAYGDTRAQAATKANVSEATIKRALKTARTTDYAKLFARTRAQKLQAKQSMKKPDEAWSLIRKLAEEDPEKLRSQIEQVIQRVQGGVESETAWDATTQNLN